MKSHLAGSQPPRMRLVYLSPVPLTSFAQRPHHFVEWFHRRFDAQVLWLDPGPTRLPKWSDWQRLSAPRGRDLGPNWSHAPWLKHLRFSNLPLEPLAAGRWLNRRRWPTALERIQAFVDPHTWLVVGKPCDLALELLQRYPHHPSVLDVMDAMPAFHQGRSSAWVRHVEGELAQRARWILASSSALLDKFARYGDKLRKVMNGLSLPPPASLPVPVTPSRTPVLGYVGQIASWFDWELVLELAARLPHAEIRLIGPCENHPPVALPPNVRLLPAIAHAAVYRTLQEFSAGLIPFKLNPLTDAVDPVKYYEYRALGLPVLTTRFGEMRARGASDGVYFIEEHLDQLANWDFAALRADAQEVAAFQAANVWDRRFDAIDFFNRSPASGLVHATP